MNRLITPALPVQWFAGPTYFRDRMVSVMNVRRLLPALLAGGCLLLTPVTEVRAQAGKADSKTVTASFYSTRYNGRRTASGQRFSSSSLTAAHRSLPFGTRVKLTNVKNNRSVVVRVTDRGPFVKGREISVTRLAARRLGFIRAGTTEVTMEVLGTQGR